MNKVKLTLFFLELKELIKEHDILTNQLIEMNQSNSVQFNETRDRVAGHGILLGERRIIAPSVRTPDSTYPVTFSDGSKTLAYKQRTVKNAGLSVFTVSACPKVYSVRKYEKGLEHGQMLFVLNQGEMWYAEVVDSQKALPKFQTEDEVFRYVTDDMSGSLVLSKYGEIVGTLSGYYENDSYLWMGMHNSTLALVSHEGY